MPIRTSWIPPEVRPPRVDLPTWTRGAASDGTTRRYRQVAHSSGRAPVLVAHLRYDQKMMTAVWRHNLCHCAFDVVASAAAAPGVVWFRSPAV